MSMFIYEAFNCLKFYKDQHYLYENKRILCDTLFLVYELYIDNMHLYANTFYNCAYHDNASYFSWNQTINTVFSNTKSSSK